MLFAFGVICCTINALAAVGAMYPVKPWERAFHIFGVICAIPLLV